MANFNSTRRTFVTELLLMLLGAKEATRAFDRDHGKAVMLVHHVFFWLKDPDSEADRDRLIQGIRTLSDIETVRGLHVAIPAPTQKREVVDDSYQVSELLFFDDSAGQDTYQRHPVHARFVEKYSPLWRKVVVYDSIGSLEQAQGGILECRE